MTNLSAGISASGAIQGVGIEGSLSIEHQMDFSDMMASAEEYEKTEVQELDGLGMEGPLYIY